MALTRNPLTLSARGKNLDHILEEIGRHKWTLGTFLEDLFAHPVSKDPRNTARRTQMVSKFLGEENEGILPHEIMDMMYEHRYSAPILARASENRPASEAKRPDAKKMARWGIRQWLVEKVEEIVDEEATAISSNEGGFHYTNKQSSWEFILQFLMRNALSLVESKGPTTLRLLIAAAYPKVKRPCPDPPSPDTLSSGAPPSYASHLAETATVSGSGNNPRNPMLITLAAYMMLMSARNLHFNLFQKVVGVWLFSNTAPYGMYAILSRLGFSSSYTSVLRLLRSLSNSAKDVIRSKAHSRAFLLIYDNINRMARAWDSDLAQKDTIHNGTAATFIELDVRENCVLEDALSVEELSRTMREEQRKDLSLDILYKCINWEQLSQVSSLHCLNFLLEFVPCLAEHRNLVVLRFRTTHAAHRMQEGRKTKLHPLATSDLNEGNTADNAKVLYDLLVTQLDLPQDEVEKLLVIFGGDQSTVEKLRTLKKFLASCPHGYTRYGWVLPLIQLWHMGWADLERILNTHWGASSADDISSFRSTNVLLGRKVKDVKCPDYYPAQHLVFDTLKADVLDCWRTELKTTNLDNYFEEHPIAFEDLLSIAERIYHKYMTSDAYTIAIRGDSVEDIFTVGDPWVDDLPSDSEPFVGDRVLANTILRNRDSLAHYEFQCGIAEGDMGRAMNVMSFWAFTFTGCRKSKYSNELLELTCNFEFEYSEALQTLVLDNWLCNLSGHQGSWFPMDLLQEKNIKQLKKMSQRRNVTFGGSFFKDIVAMNIRAFIQSIKSMRVAVGLLERSETHRRSEKAAAMVELARNMKEQGLHKFHKGRDLGHAAQDDFNARYTRFADGSRLQDFITRTLRDAGNLYGDSVTAEELEEHMPADIDDGVMPNMVIDGGLILGDKDFEQEGMAAENDILFAEGGGDESDEDIVEVA